MTGQTLLVNIRRAPSDILSNADIIKLFLIRCVESIEMTPVMSTLQVVQFPLPVQSRTFGEFGLSGGLILIESHIYIHTWTEKNYARLEISSCRKFDVDEVVKVIKVFFGRDVEIDFKNISWEEVSDG